MRRLSARVYRCSDGSWLSNPDCTRNQERADFVENLIIEELRRIARDPEIQQKAKRKVEELMEHEQQVVEAEIASLEKRLEQLWDEYTFWAEKYREGKCDEVEFEWHVERFRESREAVEKRLEELKQHRATADRRMAVLRKAQEIIADFDTAWEGLSMEERRELIQSVVESCTMWRMDDGRTKVEFVIRGYEPVTRYIERQSRADRPSMGPQALTPAQQACLYLYCHEGLDREQIAKRRGTTWGNINSILWTARKKLGADTLEEAWEIAGEYILQNLHSLPLNGRVKPRRPKAKELLTQAQRQVLQLVRKGKSPQQIADALGVSINTVYVQLRNCRERLAVGTTEEAVRKAVEFGLLN